MDKNNGGPAFPEKKPRYVAGYATNEFDPVSGMSLRDYLAAKALQGMLASETEDSQYDPKIAAERAYRMADALLRAREQ